VHESSNPSSWTSTPAGNGDAAFLRLFGVPPDARAEAPGRVNLIGEHTDHHCGFVLPTVLPQATQVALRRREDRTVRAFSAALGGEADVFTIGTEQPGRGWLDYVQGVTCVLREHGVLPPGFDVRIESSLPVGAGVSASAALVVSLIRALRALCDLPLDDLEIARLAHRVETHFVGAQVGIVDQMACSLGRPGQILLIDTRDRSVECIAWPARAELVVLDSGIPRPHAGADDVGRRRESFAAAEALGVEHLRDVDTAALPAIDALPEPLARRARHVVTENARVLAAAQALRDGALDTAGRLFAASHASMRDDYEVSTLDVDRLVALAQTDPAIHGARMTGGGFGGAVVMLARAGEGRAAAERVVAAYEAQTGRQAGILAPAPLARAAGRS
jgi:galactokinase